MSAVILKDVRWGADIFLHLLLSASFSKYYLSLTSVPCFWHIKIDIKQLRDDPDQQHPEFSVKTINSYKNQQQHRVLLQFRRYFQ